MSCRRSVHAGQTIRRRNGVGQTMCGPSDCRPIFHLKIERASDEILKWPFIKVHSLQTFIEYFTALQEYQHSYYEFVDKIFDPVGYNTLGHISHKLIDAYLYFHHENEERRSSKA
ncbi:unnamed protein product [Rotaria sp. Silwood2]|nr:unnamed protein product [Rotaria sp. Silwood2]